MFSRIESKLNIIGTLDLFFSILAPKLLPIGTNGLQSGSNLSPKDMRIEISPMKMNRHGRKGVQETMNSQPFLILWFQNWLNTAEQDLILLSITANWLAQIYKPFDNNFITLNFYELFWFGFGVMGWSMSVLFSSCISMKGESLKSAPGRIVNMSQTHSREPIDSDVHHIQSTRLLYC